jgi:hypothetical protein
MEQQESSLVPLRRIEQAILVIRGHRVMLSTDLAALYGVEPKALVQAVKRNIERFPDDFMFQLTWAEAQTLLLPRPAPGGSRSQVVTLKRGYNIKYQPYAFTEQGVAMLSSVLRSRRAVQVNVEIMRTFVRLRRILADNADLAQRLEELEKKYDVQFRVVFDAIRRLMQTPEPKKRRIGFITTDRHGDAGSDFIARDRPRRPRKPKATLAVRAGRALRRAALDARKTARFYGTPIYVWRNGKVVAEKP